MNVINVWRQASFNCNSCDHSFSFVVKCEVSRAGGRLRSDLFCRRVVIMISLLGKCLGRQVWLLAGGHWEGDSAKTCPLDHKLSIGIDDGWRCGRTWTWPWLTGNVQL